MYVYIHIYICVCIYIYIYLYEVTSECCRHPKSIQYLLLCWCPCECTYVCVQIYTYMCMNMYAHWCMHTNILCNAIGVVSSQQEYSVIFQSIQVSSSGPSLWANEILHPET